MGEIGSSSDHPSAPALIVAVGSCACAIPVHHVSETMRPLSVAPVAGTPEYIRGISVIRGMPVPVVDLTRLLDKRARQDGYGRFVAVKVGDRRFALAVDGVLGLRVLREADIEELPPLLRSVDAGHIEAIGTSDAQLLVVLSAARIVPEQVWKVLSTGTAPR